VYLVSDGLVPRVGNVEFRGKGILALVTHLLTKDLTFVDLALEILILIAVVEHFSIIGICQNLGAIAKQNNTASLIVTVSATSRPQPTVDIDIIATVTIVEIVVDTRAAELSYIYN
jgi:hypothetical protein